MSVTFSRLLFAGSIRTIVVLIGIMLNYPAVKRFCEKIEWISGNLVDKVTALLTAVDSRNANSPLATAAALGTRT
jgi:hypothetical protein